jgi:cysteinyl-tRNA synthetase
VAADPEIDKLLADREKARKAGDFESADAIREQLAAMDVQVIDTPDGTRWRRI